MQIFSAHSTFRQRLTALAATAIGVSTLITTSVLLLPSAAHAQVSLSPLILEAQTERGLARTSITVTNGSAQPFRARITAEPFSYESEGGFTTLEPGAVSDLTPYLLFSPTELVVPANSSRRIRLMARLPLDAEEREYRAVIFTEPLQARTTESGAAKINTTTRIAATLYVRNGELVPELVGTSAQWDSTERHLKMTVNNNGTASVRPVATWILNQGETTVASGRSRATAIMPQNSRNFILTPTTQLSEELPSGSYQLKGEFIWGSNVAPLTQPFELDVQI